MKVIWRLWRPQNSLSVSKSTDIRVLFKHWGLWWHQHGQQLASFVPLNNSQLVKFAIVWISVHKKWKPYRYLLRYIVWKKKLSKYIQLMHVNRSLIISMYSPSLLTNVCIRDIWSHSLYKVGWGVWAGGSVHTLTFPLSISVPATH